MTQAHSRARRVAEALWKREGTGRAFGIRIVSAGEGQSEVAMTVTPEMLNGHGSAHGGMIFTLADTAFAYACNSGNVRTVAQAASIAFLSPARPGEELTARAGKIAEEGRSGSYGVVVHGEDGRIVATFQGLSRIVGGTIVEQDE